VQASAIRATARAVVARIEIAFACRHRDGSCPISIRGHPQTPELRLPRTHVQADIFVQASAIRATACAVVARIEIAFAVSPLRPVGRDLNPGIPAEPGLGLPRTHVQADIFAQASAIRATACAVVARIEIAFAVSPSRRVVPDLNPGTPADPGLRLSRTHMQAEMLCRQAHSGYRVTPTRLARRSGASSRSWLDPE
jgi:hypothetical protein